MDYFVDAKSLVVPFQMNSSLLGSHTILGTYWSVYKYFYQVYLEIIRAYYVSYSIARDYWMIFFSYWMSLLNYRWLQIMTTWL